MTPDLAARIAALDAAALIAFGFGLYVFALATERIVTGARFRECRAALEQEQERGDKLQEVADHLREERLKDARDAEMLAKAYMSLAERGGHGRQ